MDADSRRKEILNALSGASSPVSASALASALGVSRQIIVGDVALLRAAGEQITATPRGYTLLRTATVSDRYLGTVACIHTVAGMEEELTIMVDNGCTVVNVIVEHPLYGQITAELDLSSKSDVSHFMEKLLSEEAQPLSSLTAGVHLHTLRCPDLASYSRTVESLRQAKLLYTAETAENS